MKRYTKGILSILVVYSIWGLQPLYWKLFETISLKQILAYRILWSTLILLLIMAYKNRIKDIVGITKNKKEFIFISICAFLISINWILNIYAAYTNQIIEASLGHYITPLVVIFLGVFLLKESIKKYEFFAIIITFIAVINLTLKVGKLPIIAILLVGSFATYTYLKKMLDIDSLLSITIELLILSPFALFFLINSNLFNVKTIINLGFFNNVLIASTGIFTSIPLLLYSYGVKRIRLSELGFIQYYAPTLSLLIGIFIFNENFSKDHLISFSLIWISISIIILYPHIVKIKNQLR